MGWSIAMPILLHDTGCAEKEPGCESSTGTKYTVILMSAVAPTSPLNCAQQGLSPGPNPRPVQDMIFVHQSLNAALDKIPFQTELEKLPVSFTFWARADLLEPDGGG